MFASILKMIVGSKNERYLKSLTPTVDKITSLEPAMQALEQGQLQTRISELRQEAANGRSLDEMLPEVFAMVREAGRRTMDMRHFDVQLIGGMVLHQGKIAEMKTGEGKTLVATLPAVLNALSGKGVHLVTVNDYLARRDAAWMGAIYNYLGLSVGTILHGLTDEERKEAYGADITYGTNNEFGFDYLRDNMKFYKEHLVQREHNFAIVDEVDSILIDEARTPLIISGPAEESTAQYSRVATSIPMLKPEVHFTKDEKARTVLLTDEGVARCEEIFKIENLYDPAHISLQHHVLQGLRAHHLYARDVDYIVKDDQVIIVDEFTGRLMPGRRYSDGLHQSLEAKEGVKVESENQTLASITFQNYFRMYKKLSGMTGTADTEAVEFRQIYGLEVAVIPTHRPMVRLDHPDIIYKTQQEKFAAIVNDLRDLHKKGQPVLVGTISIEKSEMLSQMLKKAGVPHDVLNAKQHEREAQIVAEAGHKGRVTIATNMAGRGTDIKLGEGVKEQGGLFILGTERHESRRIDNQLRGRSGRQGDPGASRFYLALDDDLMRLFGSDRLKGIMEKLGMQEGEAIENRMVSKAIENAQKRVEGHNFEIRKQLLDFDNVMNQQREVIYSRRRHYMETEAPEEVLLDFVDEMIDDICAPLEMSKQGPSEEDLEIVAARMEETFNLRWDPAQGAFDKETLRQAVVERFKSLRAAAPDHYGEILRYFLLEALDKHWKEHLLNMDHLRDGIGLRGYGQKDPKQEYKREGFELFQGLLGMIADTTVRHLSRLQIRAEVREEEFQHKEKAGDLQYQGAQDGQEKKAQPKKRTAPKVGRNDPCTCGSGKKYKKCCGAKG
ncbi:Protein translocase subunit SecA [Fundidesulfovibrio magnetotacticus]|uniref:Protein translocase subunit SecA n=1 Tax=Fundidesulfovibrio magnetotacticus TaxID=2730080 RepID=A0A6V8LTN7_9BACT|nr:preprotein translocase subunit SecA [Fundidesulfovibrio magnetotacticus]GFK93459.1 Protein translocase subunit SecA [Fundidesulfovibrio magnetotacticus]